MRTSYAPGHPQVSWRDGYRVIRKAGRYLVFPRAAFSEMMGWHGASDGLVEIWNGMPFFSPVWARAAARRVAAPRARHDVGDDAAAAARAARAHASSSGSRRRSTARTPIVTLSESSKRRARRTSSASRPTRITVVPPGHRSVVLARRRRESPTPLVVARRPARAGEALRPARSTRSPRARPRHPGAARGRSSARATSARRSRRQIARARRRATGSRCPGRVDDDDAARPLPAGVGARERVGARGLGHDDHRGRRVRHARGRDAHRRARRRGRRRHAPACSPTTRASSRPRSTACSPTTRCARRSARTRSSTRRGSRGRATARGTLEVLAAEALRRRT